MLTADHMRTLSEFFFDIPDPRCKQGQRHSLPCVLAISAGGVLCGMEGYKAISGWAEDLGQKARERFGCRKRNGYYSVPSRSTFRETYTLAHGRIESRSIWTSTLSMQICHWVD